MFDAIYLATDVGLIETPSKWLSTKFHHAKIRSSYLPESSIVPSIVEAITGDKWQEVYDSPNAVRMIVAELTDEDSPDSSHYTLPFFNIKKLRLPIAMELVRGLDDPDISEFTKRVAFDLLMRVELVTKESNTY